MAGTTGKAGKPKLAAIDHVTVLKTTDEHSASKRFVRTDQGIQKVDYNAGYNFYVAKPFQVSSIHELSDLLSLLEKQPKMLVIRGQPLSSAVINTWQRRKGDGQGAAFKQAPRRWVLVDFDKILLPRGLTMKPDDKSIERIGDFLVSKLPPEFHGASYHWQLSSSAGLGDPTVVSMHLWFWLTEPVTDKDMKTWTRWWNQRVGSTLIDDHLFQCVQAHYTAAPEFEGLSDPFPKRSGLRKKARNEVCLALPEPEASSPVARNAAAGRRGTGKARAAHTESGFEYHLSRIGDHPGGDGFHGPIVSAAASYVIEHGAEGTDVEHLYALIRDAVMKGYADPARHDAETVEQRASREHIIPAIESALEKYGNIPRTRRKARLHDNVAPHFSGEVISVDEAQHILKAFATHGR